MKLKNLLAVLSVLSAAATLPAQTNSPLVAHEWGTFTSFQGGDGVLLNWKPLETSVLPKFVHDWNSPGLDRKYVGDYVGKNLMVTLQRMETPVIYFYSDQYQSVDLSVGFPQGRITEWYPQADQVGPSRPALLRAINAVALSVTNYSPTSLIHWANLLIAPRREFDAGHETLPTDTSGSHYFAARDTDSDYIVSAPVIDSTNSQPEMERLLGCGGAPARPVEAQQSRQSFSMAAKIVPARPIVQTPPEVEKFLFYRGVGSFATPLRVTMSSDDAVTVANTGGQPLAHLFILGVKNHAGNFVYVSELQPGEQKTVTLEALNSPLPAAELTATISGEMSGALEKSGLYAREASAMVNTWKDSWFQEDGLRVLYVLPRPWTDKTLPMTVNPTPQSLIRVMVGRAEIFAPAAERALTLELNQAVGHADASAAARQTLKGLGRFAEPAFYRALAATKLPAADQTKLFALLAEARKSE